MIKYLILGVLFFITPVYADHSLSQYTSEMEVKYKISTGLLVSICTVESHWRNVKGKHGEIGVCQLRPSSVEYALPELSRASTSYFKYGDKDVLPVQERLKRIGLYKGKLDGIFGPLTYHSVLSYQALHKLNVDGVVGPKTWAKLIGSPYPAQALEAKLWNPKENIEINP